MRFYSLLATLVLSGASLAQEGRLINCRFAGLDSRAPVPAMLTLSADGLETPVSVPTASISKPVPCFATGDTLKFIAAADRTPLATVTIPASVKAAILLFVPAQKTGSSLPWRVFVIEDSEKNFPDGGAFVANFHSDDIRFIIGEHKMLLPPGRFSGVAPPTKRDDFNMAPVVFQFQKENTWRDASETMLRFLPSFRYLMITFLDPESGRPKVVTIQDFKPTGPVAARP